MTSSLKPNVRCLTRESSWNLCWPFFKKKNYFVLICGYMFIPPLLMFAG